MERNADLPEPVIIAQDDQSEIHVQPVVQSGRRLLDVRVWRRGSSGLAPSRTGINLDAGNLGALVQGVGELLDASNGGRSVARVVWDAEEGQRLRAETEPFGTRYLARLGFWQRVRDTWKPVDDGVVLGADTLSALQATLVHFRRWVESTDDAEPAPPPRPTVSTLDAWPPAGGDWLTIEAERIALHPRGVRLTFTVFEQDGHHRLIARQWRREDMLWLPEAASISLSIRDLDRVLAALQDMAEAQMHGQPVAEHLVVGDDGPALRLRIGGHGPTAALLVTQQSARTPEEYEPRITIPAEYVPRLGRALAQGWYLLTGWLTDEERQEIAQSQADPVPVPLPAELHAPPGPVQPPAPDEPPDSPAHVPEEAPHVPVQIFSFGAESETPGTVVPNGPEVRVVVEGYMFPRTIGLPVEVIPQVLQGLDRLDEMRHGQTRIDPTLLCDRPDCAVYGRVGTAMRPDAVELRVWTGPATSDAVSFEVIYLPDLIDALRQALQVLGHRVPPAPVRRSIPAVPPSPLPQSSAPARVSALAPGLPLEGPGRAQPGGPASSRELAVPLGQVTLGASHISMRLQGYQESPILQLQWEGNTMELPLRHLEELLTDLRGLYYDALRGRRGRTISVGEYPVITISVHNQGTQLHCVLQQDLDGDMTTLSFPANEVLTFLNAARSALTRLESENQ